MRFLARPILRGVCRFNDKAKRLAIHLVYWTGKHPERVHPKHLLADDSHRWYLPHISPDSVLLDMGCGNGVKSIACAGKECAVVGVDRDEGQLRIASRESRRRGLEKVLFCRGELEKPLAFQSDSFDAVLFFDVLEHLRDRDQSLREIRRILKPGGRLFLSVPNRETSWKKCLKWAGLFYYSDADHKVEYTWEELTAELRRSGFQAEGYEPEVYDTPWVGLIDLTGGIYLPLYRRLSRWKIDAVKRRPQETIGFRVICRKTAS